MLGVRAYRPEVAGSRTIKETEDEAETEVKGEAVGSVISASELEARGIIPNHNSINSQAGGEVMGESIEADADQSENKTASELLEQGIYRARNTNK